MKADHYDTFAESYARQNETGLCNAHYAQPELNLFPYVLNMPLDYIDENGEELGLALLKKLAAAACMAAVLHGPVAGTDT